MFLQFHFMAMTILYKTYTHYSSDLYGTEISVDLDG